MKSRSAFAMVSVMLATMVALLNLGALSAHHAFEGAFDARQVLTLNGVVARVEWTNPHISILVNVQASDGKVESWSLEGPSPSALSRVGIDRNFFKAGMNLEVCGYRAKDGAKVIGAESLTPSGGQMVRWAMDSPGKCFSASPETAGRVTVDVAPDPAARRLEDQNVRYRTVLLKLRQDVRNAEGLATSATSEERLSRLVDQLYLAATDQARSLEEAAGEPATLRRTLESLTNSGELLKKQIAAAIQSAESDNALLAKQNETLANIERVIADIEKAALRWAARENAERESVVAWIAPFLSAPGAGGLSLAVQSAPLLSNRTPQMRFRPAREIVADVSDAPQSVGLPSLRPVPPQGTVDSKLAATEQVQLRIADLRARSRAWSEEVFYLQGRLSAVRNANEDLREQLAQAREVAAQVAQNLDRVDAKLDTALRAEQSLVADTLRSAVMTFVWNRLKSEVQSQMLPFLAENQQVIVEAASKASPALTNIEWTDENMKRLFGRVRTGQAVFLQDLQWKGLENLNAAERKVLDATLHFDSYASKAGDSSEVLAALAREVRADVRPAGLEMILKARADLSEALQPLASQLPL